MHRDADIEIDLSADWVALVRNALTANRYTAPAKDEDACFAFFNLLKRLVESRPRTVHVASSLVCPPELKAGYDEVTRKVTTGEDLRPHLSKRLVDIDYDDGLLSDWGIHHLHLGTLVGKDGFVDRTGPVLFSRFTGSEAFFIAIQKHGAWADQRLLEEFAANWPTVAQGFELKGVMPSQPNPTSDDIAKLRKAGVQTLVSIGGKVMFPMGGGISTSGLAIEAVRRSDNVHRQLRAFEEAVVAQKADLFADAARKNVVLPRPVRLRLRLDNDQVAFALTEDGAFGFRLTRLIL